MSFSPVSINRRVALAAVKGQRDSPMRIRLWLSVVVVTAVLSTGCKGGTSCTSWAGGYGERSQVSWGQCSDDAKREIECNRRPDGKSDCKCMKDGAVVKTFEHADGILGNKEESSRIANEMCGWDLSL